MPSSRRRVRPAPLGPKFRRVTPCVVGFAVRLLLRRNRLKPGTSLRRTSSSRSCGARRRSSDSSAVTEKGADDSALGRRSAETTTVSVEEADCALTTGAAARSASAAVKIRKQTIRWKYTQGTQREALEKIVTVFPTACATGREYVVSAERCSYGGHFSRRPRRSGRAELSVCTHRLRGDSKRGAA